MPHQEQDENLSLARSMLVPSHIQPIQESPISEMGTLDLARQMLAPSRQGLHPLEIEQVTGTRDLSLREQVAFMAGRQPATESDGFFWNLLEEFVRPQKALFAGMRDLALNDDLSRAIKVATDEFTSKPFLGGSFKRDVQFSDVLFPINQERTTGEAAIGFLGDLAIDPLLLPGVTAATGKVFRLLKSGAGKALRQLEKVPPRGSNVYEELVETFVGTIPETSIGKAVQEVTKKTRRTIERERDKVVHALWGTSKQLEKFRKEAGVSYDEALTFIRRNVEENKLPGDELFRVIGEGDTVITKADADKLGRRVSNTPLTPLETRIHSELTTMEDEIYRLGIQDYQDFANRAKLLQKAVSRERPLRRAIISEQLGKVESEIAEQLSPRAQEMAADLILDLKDNRLNSIIWEKMTRIATGKKRKALDQLNFDIWDSASRDYILWNTTREAKQLFQKKMPFANLNKWGFEWSPTHASELESMFRKAGITSIQEANDLTQAGELVLRSGKDVADFRGIGFTLFEQNPVVLDTIRAYYSERAVRSINMLDNLADEFGFQLTKKQLASVTNAKGNIIPKKMIQLKKSLGTKNGIPVEDYRRLRLDGFEDVMLPGDAADVLEKYWQAANNKDVLGRVAGAITRTNSIWKAGTLFIFAEYHFRNAVSNQFQKFLGGMNPVEIPGYSALALWTLSKYMPAEMRNRFAKAGVEATGKGTGKIGRLLGKLDETTDTLKLGGKEWEVTDLIDILEKEGIVGSGFYSQEFIESLEQTARATGGESTLFEKIFTIEGNPFLRGGVKTAKLIEESDRVALFLHQLDKGKSVKEASEHTFKFLFDFGDLTDREKRIFRGILFPFYSWTRKNIPLQLEYLIKEPAKFATLVKGKKAIEADIQAGAAPDEKFLSEFVRNSASIRTKRDKNGDYHFWLLDNWIPMAEIAKLDPKNPDTFRQAISRELSPSITTFIETLTQKDLFFDQPFGAGRSEFLGFNIGDNILNILRNFRILTTIDRFVGLEESDPSAAQALLRTATGISTVKQNIRIGKSVFRSNRRQALNNITSEMRLAARNNNDAELARLRSERDRVQENDLSAIKRWQER